MNLTNRESQLKSFHEQRNQITQTQDVAIMGSLVDVLDQHIHEFDLQGATSEVADLIEQHAPEILDVLLQHYHLG